MKLLRQIPIVILCCCLPLATFNCTESDVTVNEGIDPFSPKPGEPDKYEDDNSTEVATYLNWDSGGGAFVSGGKLSGMSQKHNFHERIDEDWYVLETRQDHRAVVVETFDVSSDISTIVQLFFKEPSGNLVKVMGSDVVNGDPNSPISCTETISLATLNTYGFDSIPECPQVTGSSLQFQLKLKRKPGTGPITYFIKVTVPPFKYREGIDAVYYIRSRGTGDTTLLAPTNVVASRDIYADRVLVTWDQVAGATSYRVVRAESQVAANVTCDVSAGWPCDDLGDFQNTGAMANPQLVLEKKQVTASWKERIDDDDLTPPPVPTVPGCDTSGADQLADACDTTVLDVNSTVYSDQGTWNLTSTSSPNIIECNSDGSLDTNDVYLWAPSSIGYRTNATSISDTTDPNGYLPKTKATLGTNDNYYDPFPGSITCAALPYDNNTADNPAVGKIYYYAVYSCDEALEDCRGPSSTTEQANDTASSGGGSIKINIPAPQLVYVSETNDEGIWLAFTDVASNKTTSTASENLHMRYSIRRSESPSGPFNAAAEVESQFDGNGAVALTTLLREFDGNADATPLDPTKTYYYAVVAQQLRDSGDPGMCGTSDNCHDGDQTSNRETRQGEDASLGVTETYDTTVASAPNESGAGADDGAFDDTAYLDLQLTSESPPSNVLAGRIRRLQNWAMCMATTDPTETGYVQIISNQYKKELILTNIDPDGGSPGALTTVTTYDLVKGSWITGQNRRVSDLCTAINGLGDWECTTSDTATCQNQYGVDMDAAAPLTKLNYEAPAVLLADTNGQVYIPEDNNAHGDRYRPFALESRVLATQGYEPSQIDIQWAPISEANSSPTEVQSSAYEIYRTTSTTASNIAALEITYHGDATSATLTISSNIMGTQLSGQTDQSANFSLDLAGDALYDTIDEVASFLNSRKGYSARVINKQFRVTASSALLSTTAANLKIRDSRGMAAPLTLSASGTIPIFSNTDTPLTTINVTGPNFVSDALNYKYIDGAPLGGTTFYSVRAVASDASGRKSDFFIVGAGFSRPFGAVASKFDSLVPCSATNSPGNNTEAPGTGCSCGATGTNPNCMTAGMTTGADGDVYDLNDHIAADHVQFALAQGTPWLIANHYSQYEQRDNDRFPKNDSIVNADPTAPALPHFSGRVFETKIGTHEPQPIPTWAVAPTGYRNLCQWHGSSAGYPGVDHTTFDHDHWYLSIGYDGLLRENQGTRHSLPCSFRQPGTGVHNAGDAQCFADGASRWPGDPDIIYDYNGTTGGTEPLHRIEFTFNSPMDEDVVWFFGQERFYEYSSYTDYSNEYRPGVPGYTIQNNDDPGCGPSFFETQNWYGPFAPFVSLAQGSDNVAKDSNIPLYSKPCSDNLPAGLPVHTAIAANSDNGYPGDDTNLGRAYQKKKYTITHTVNPFNPLGFSGPIIVDVYVIWPNLDWFNDVDRAATPTYFAGAPGIGTSIPGGPSGGQLTGYGKYVVTPNLDQAPFYSLRLDPNTSASFKTPASFHVNEYRGIGMIDFPACDQTAYGGGSTVNKAHSGGGPCMLSPACTMTATGGFLTQRDNAGSLTNDCARIPLGAIALCNDDTNSDYIFDDLTTNATGVGLQTACKPAPFYQATVPVQPNGNYYRGNTCSSQVTNPTACPPPGMHIILKAYSPTGSTGRILLEVREFTPPPQGDTFP